MTPIEAVEYMRSSGSVNPDGWDTISYKMCHHDKIMGLLKSTSCASKVLGFWDVDEFIKIWYNSGDIILTATK